MAKRFLSILLILCTLLACLPAMAAAEGAPSAEPAVTASAEGEDCHSMTEKWFGPSPAKRSAPGSLDYVLDSYFSFREADFQDAPATRKGAISSSLSTTVQKHATLRAEGLQGFQQATNIRITDAEVTTFRDEEHIIQNNDGTVTMFIYEWTFFDYDDLSNAAVGTDVSGHGVSHKVTLKVVDGSYQILSDEYDDRDFVGLCTMNESTKQELIAMDYQPVETEVSIIEALKSEFAEDANPATRAGSFYTNYDPNKAVEYADKWVYHNAKGSAVYESYYNSAYANFNSVGGDCANYTSQCIYAGGIPMVECEEYGLSGWYYRTSTDRSGTWTVVRHLRNWMANNRGTLVNSADSDDIYMGSPLTYNNAHAVICVGRNSAGTAIINSHNNDWYHGLWNYWKNATYTTVQLTSYDPSLVQETHKHNYVNLTYDWYHPHALYKECVCGARSYTGEYWTRESCETCFPVAEDPKYNQFLPCTVYPQKGQNIYTYNSPHLRETTGGEIYANDQCTITKIYENGACKVTYPVSGGTRTAYSQLSEFFSAAVPEPILLKNNATTYTRVGGTSCGYAAGGDTVYSVDTSGNMTQILYPIKSGYKCGWVYTSSLPAVIPYTQYSSFCPILGYSYVTDGFPLYAEDRATVLKTISPDAQCSIKKVYSDGWCQLACNSAAGTVSGYARLSNFIYDPSAKITKYYAKWQIPVYSTNNTEKYDGWYISKDSPYYLLGSCGSMVQALYPSDAGASYYVLCWLDSTTLTAPEYPVIYNAKGGTNAPAAQSKQLDVTLKLSFDEPAKEGYTFLGWDTSSAGKTVVYLPGANYTENSTLTLYAVWAPATYTVTYYANNEIDSPFSQVKNHNVPLTLSSKVPIRYGWFFMGWATADSYPYIAYAPGDIYSENKDLSLYAVWTDILYEVFYDANGGTGAPEDQCKGRDLPLYLSETVPTRTGYTFLGWATEKNSTEIAYRPGDIYQKNEPITLFAVWQVNAPSGPCAGGGTCPSKAFIDVPGPKDWAHEGIDYAVSNGLFNGTSKNAFSPNNPMTRAMLVTVLWRYAGCPKIGENQFSDVEKGTWYTEAVAWAAAEGVVHGVGKGRFAPENTLTREQLATILFRYAAKLGMDSGKRADLTGFPDHKSISPYAQECLSWAVAEGLIKGSSGKLLPQGDATRAQVAAILMRFIENVAKK